MISKKVDNMLKPRIGNYCTFNYVLDNQVMNQSLN